MGLGLLDHEARPQDLVLLTGSQEYLNLGYKNWNFMRFFAGGAKCYVRGVLLEWTYTKAPLFE